MKRKYTDMSVYAEKLDELLETKMTRKDIADILGVSTQSVIDYIKRKNKKIKEINMGIVRKDRGCVIKKISEWRMNNPNGTLEQCVEDTKVSKPTALKYLGNDFPRSMKSKKYRNSKKYIVLEWKKNNSNGTLEQCVEDTKVSKPTALKYLGNDFPRSMKSKKCRNYKKDIVLEWKKNNSNGTLEQCIEDIKVSKPTALKYLGNDFPRSMKSKKGRSSKKDIVLEWRRNNPNGIKEDCYRDTGTSRSTIRKYWNQSNEKE